MSEAMQLIFIIAASVFEMIITMIYCEIIFRIRKHWAVKPIYYLTYIGISTLFWFARIPDFTWLGNILISLIEVFLFTVLYETKLIARLFASISFIVFSMISEVAANSIITGVKSFYDIQTPENDMYIYAVMLSKLIKFIMVLIVLLILKRNSVKADFKDYLCMIIVPLISIFIIIAVTVESKDNAVNAGFPTNTAILGILIINFIVYYLLNNIIQANEIRQKQAIMESQFMFQEKKYEQTSMSFKSISGILHDTNKHLVYLRECVIQEDYNEAVGYIDKAVNNLSASYKRINTGLLVIDALVSNAYNTAEVKNIKFRTDIKIDKNQINTERYDLSVVLGNLLDNAIEACVKISNIDDRFINVNIFTNDTALVVNILNSTVGNIGFKNFASDKPDKIMHGYGLSNVNLIAEKYGGSFVAERKESRFEATVVLPFVSE
ncbi:MAG: GHKL domain-containing protein [Ruminococcus flavefaciens]|nr:GHKL domain-containing protein [Ruminococcus flavefaciens]